MGKVGGYCRGCIAGKNNCSTREHQRCPTEVLNGSHLMADEKNGPAAATGNFLHFAQTSLLELGVPDREDLIYYENVRLKVSRNSKREADIHPRTVAFDRSVKELGDFGKGHDL